MLYVNLQNINKHGAGMGAKIHEIPDLSRVPDPMEVYESNKGIIIIDNGSYECKAGWSSDEKPSLVFRSHSTKIRGQKGGEIYVGNDIANYEANGWMPLKSPFEKNIASHPETQEHIMDHIFIKMGLNGVLESVNYPVVFTEPLCNPNYYRQYMSELLFECYGVSSVVYGIDSMLSLEYNLPNVNNALVVALGHNVSHVIPMLNDEIHFKQSRRISIGGQHITSTLQRLLQLKHPHLAVAIGAARSEYLTHTYCQYALDYQESVSKFQSDEYSKENTIRIQLPLNSIQSSTSATTTSGKMDVCSAIVVRVESVMSTKIRSKIIDSQEKLKQLEAIKEVVIMEEDARKRQTIISDLGLSTLEDLEAVYDDLKQTVEISMQSDLPAEVDLSSFSDPDSWLAALRKCREDLKYQISLKSNEDNVGDVEMMLDRIELIIFETEREFKRTSVLDIENLKCSSAISNFYQLHLGTERFRAPEVLFQPTALLGLEQTGLIETIERVLQQFSIEDQNRMCEQIFLTGGPACLPAFKDRLEREIRAIRPFESKFNVILARQPALDAWNGAKLIANDASLMEHFSVTRADYDEFGPDYIKKFKWSNIYAPSPLVVRI